MFGISLAELLVIIIISLIFISPKDLPEIARYLAKIIIKARRIFEEAKKELKTIGNQIGLDEIKNEVEMELMKDKIKKDQEPVTIIDIYGNEHQIHGIEELRPDKTKEEIREEIKNYNQNNFLSKNQKELEKS